MQDPPDVLRSMHLEGPWLVCHNNHLYIIALMTVLSRQDESPIRPWGHTTHPDGRRKHRLVKEVPPLHHERCGLDGELYAQACERIGVSPADHRRCLEQRPWKGCSHDPRVEAIIRKAKTEYQATSGPVIPRKKGYSIHYPPSSESDDCEL